MVRTLTTSAMTRSRIDARDGIAASHRGDYRHDLEFVGRVADADCRPPHNANGRFSKRYSLTHDS